MVAEALLEETMLEPQAVQDTAISLGKHKQLIERVVTNGYNN
jgi:hypothetical protein